MEIIPFEESEWYELPVGQSLFNWLIDCFKEFSNYPDRVCLLVKNSGFYHHTKVLGRHMTASLAWLDITYYQDDLREDREDWKIYQEEEILKEHIDHYLKSIPLDRSEDSFRYVLNELRGKGIFKMAELPDFICQKIIGYWKKNNNENENEENFDETLE